MAVILLIVGRLIVLRRYRLPGAFTRIAQRVDHMVVLVLKQRQDRSRKRICSATVQRQFIDQMLTTGMHDDIEALKPLNTLLN